MCIAFSVSVSLSLPPSPPFFFFFFFFSFLFFLFSFFSLTFLLSFFSSLFASLFLPFFFFPLPVSHHNPCRSFQSSSQCRLSIPGLGENTNKKHSDARSFRNAAPTGLWKRLPETDSKLQMALIFSAAGETVICFQPLGYSPASSSSAPSPHLLPSSPLKTFPSLVPFSVIFANAASMWLTTWSF